MQAIEIDTDVWQLLQTEAKPLVDDPNSVLRRLLGLDSGNSQPRARAHSPGATPRSSRGGRAPLGSLLPETEYELPILEELDARSGSAPAREITRAVGERLRDSLTKLDLERLGSGDIRWENRVHFTRLRLRERGFLKSGSPRGVWELTERGRRAARKGEVPN